MGLIDKYGTDLLGKIFIWIGNFNISSPGDVWIIGKIVGYPMSHTGGCSYKILQSSHIYLSGWEQEFFFNDVLDRDSILIDDSLEFEKYLELFSGID